MILVGDRIIVFCVFFFCNWSLFSDEDIFPVRCIVYLTRIQSEVITRSNWALASQIYNCFYNWNK